MSKNTDKLTICFSPWMVFFKDDNYDAVISEIKHIMGMYDLWDKLLAKIYAFNDRQLFIRRTPLNNIA